MTKTKVRRSEQKRKLAEIKGGICKKCGYSKNLAAFDFHHREASLKDGVIGMFINFHKFEDALKESEKCDLLCKNCHAELHNPDLDIVIENGSIRFKNNEMNNANQTCGICGEYCGGKIFCSEKCSAIARRRVKERPSLEELQQILEKTSFSAAGRKYGVSDNAVRKWAKTYNLI